MLSRLMCFVVGLSFGADAGAHQKKKSSSNSTLTPAEWTVIFSTLLLGNELILKPLAGKLFGKGGNKIKINKLLENERKAYIQSVLDSIEKTVDEGSENEWLKTIPKSLCEIRQVLHCLFLRYSTLTGKDVENVKLTVGKNINWSYDDNIEKALAFESVYKILKWYSDNSTLEFYYNNLVPLNRFGFAIQRWAEKMGFSKIEIVMDSVGGCYVNDYLGSSINFKIHGFKYQLSDDEHMILMKKLGLEDIDTLEVFNDDG